MPKLIEDYGLIGDGETAALVNRNGSIDWLCWPRFDSDACFAALLGTEDHGYWQIAPSESVQITRRYRTDTLILDTDFSTTQGAVRLTDFMPIRAGASVLVRSLAGLHGTVRVRSALNLQFDYGSMPPSIDVDGSIAIAQVGPDLAVVRAPVPLEMSGGKLIADLEVKAGEQAHFVLSYGDSSKPVPKPIDPPAALAETERFWRDWISRYERKTDWQDAVRRSLITLKAMIYRPSGGVVAAPTTSLPEEPGGEMNWDYRYSWLRDATFTLSALINSGFQEEAVAWRNWLLRAVAGAPEKMRIMYRVDGARRLEEWSPAWLPGFRWATPVRIGNAAAVQLQLDVYGELLDALHLASKAGMELSEQGLKLQDAVVHHVASVWRLPDCGLWEERGKPRHHIYSKVAAWVALDRYLSGEITGKRPNAAELARLTALRKLMHEEICREGYDDGLGTFVSYYGGHEVDGGLLLLPIVGFLPVSDVRVANTIRRIEDDLVQDGLVRRWKAGNGNPEGSFLACSCWLAQCQAMQGRHDTARATFERVLSVQNDLGLLAEEYDVRSHRLCGNFPQALSHLAVVQTALLLCGPVLKRGSDR